MRKISTPARTRFLEIYAEIEATFTPFRFDRRPESSKIAAALFDRREDYRRTGLPIVRGGLAADRVSGSKLMNELRRAGLVETQGGTSLTVRLTDLGDWYGQAITPNDAIELTWPLFGCVAALQDAGFDNEGFVSETFLVSKEYDQVEKLELLTLEDRLGFYLRRGWLASQSDSRGRIGYSVTAEGREVLEAGCPVRPEGLPEYDTELFDECYELSEAAYQASRRLKPLRANSIYIPLSAGLWPHPPIAEARH